MIYTNKLLDAKVFVPPGTLTPLEGQTKKQARRNVNQFILDLELSGTTSKFIKKTKWVYVFELEYQTKTVIIEMPGIPLEKLRWLDSSQSIRLFPRITVEDNTWVWKFAVSQAKNCLLSQ